MVKKRKTIGKIIVGKNVADKILAIIPPIGDYSSRKEWEDACWRKMAESEEILNLLTTSYERRDLVMRAAVLNGFISGKSYRQISKEIFISLQTISAIKKAIKENHYRSYKERSKTERKKKKYSSNRIDKKKHKQWRVGRRVRTKYGTIYVHH